MFHALAKRWNCHRFQEYYITPAKHCSYVLGHSHLFEIRLFWNQSVPPPRKFFQLFFLPLSRDSGLFFRLDHELFFRPRLLFMSSQTSHWHSLISSFNQWFLAGTTKKRVHGTLEDRELRFGANLGNGKKGIIVILSVLSLILHFAV